MGRPREHDERTRSALLEAAEKLLAQQGPAGLSIRNVAEEAGTTTRAVYTLFRSKEGLLDALATRVYELLLDGLHRLPETDDPAQDLVDAAVSVFRPMAVDHPALYQLAYQRVDPELGRSAARSATARAAFSHLTGRVQRLAEAGVLRDRQADAAALQFHALCEGMAAVELRWTRSFEPDPEQLWRDAFAGFVAGLGSALPHDVPMTDLT
jgi:AcrR family transcriptional regulator